MNDGNMTHSWAVAPGEARAIQQRLAERVERQNRYGELRWVAGVDVGFESAGAITRAAVVVLDCLDLRPVDAAIARLPTSFPYVPGLLSFREAPAVMAALEQLSCQPDILLCDGQGIAHPRRCGIACHLGLLRDLPAIGVGKSRLVGAHQALGSNKGDWVPLHDRGETVGAVLRTRSGVKPVYVSIGHRIDLASAIELVLQCTTRFRLPETTRWADRLASNRSTKTSFEMFVKTTGGNDQGEQRE